MVSEGDTSSGDRINLVDATDGIKNGGQIPPVHQVMEFYYWPTGADLQANCSEQKYGAKES